MLDEIVLRVIAIERGAEKPLRIRGLRPIEAHVEQVVAKWNGNICGDSDGIDARDQAVGGELGEGIKFGLRVWLVAAGGNTYPVGVRVGRTISMLSTR